MSILFHKHRCLLLCGFLIITTLAIYWPVLKHEFVNYDDDKYVTENRHITDGITRRSVIWVFTSPHFHMWHPLTSLSHMLDCQLFGLNPAWHHLTSLLFHIASTLLLFGILKRMTGAIWPSFFVAAAFALHPLNVESVAWVAERKNVLSSFFWMLTIAAYISYAKRPSMGRLLVVVLIFALSTMTKPMVVTLPFVLLLLDYWPLGRLQWQRQSKEQDYLHCESMQLNYQGPSAWRLFAEKIPLFILAAVLSAITFIVQQRGGVVFKLDNVPLKFRMTNAFNSYAIYIVKMIWPSRLAVFYPHPLGKLSIWQVAAAVLLLLAVSAGVICLARSRKYLPVGWLWYLGTLVPVIGLVQVGAQARADRYAYLSFIGRFIMIAWGLTDLLAKWRYRKIILGTVAPAVLLALSIGTRLQLHHWRNNTALFEHAINVTEDNFIMHNNYANVLNEAGQLDKAIEHYYKSLQIKPDSALAHNNLGIALYNLGKLNEAIEHYKKAQELNPKFSKPHFNLAVVLAKQGKTDEAIAEYRQALRFRPDDIDALSNLGLMLAKQGDFGKAIEHYKKALELEPDNLTTHGRLGLVLAHVGNINEAIRELRIVLNARPENAEIHFNVGVLLERQGKVVEAIKAYQQALRVDPDHTKARERLKAALAKIQGQVN